MRILAMNTFGNVSSTKQGDFLLYSKIENLEQAIRSTSKNVERAVSANSFDLVKQGSLLYTVKKQSEGNRKMVRAKSMGL